MNWSSFAQAMRLRAKLPPTPGRIQNGSRLLSAFLARAEHPYVAFSTGKDSLAALDMTLALRTETPVVWHDEDWIIPGTLETLTAVEAHYGIHILRVRERFAADEFFASYGVWPQCSNRRPVDFEADRWDEITEHFGWDGAIIALRADESFGRRMALKRPMRWHKGKAEWHVSPVHDWTVFDVWAYLLSRQLPYHPAYEQMVNLGVPIEHARVGPLTATRVYQYGSLITVKKLWPEVWNQFVLENPCVAGEA